MSAHSGGGSDGRSARERPVAVAIPAAFLLAAPALQVAAARLQARVLNFGEPRLAAYLVYGVAAPLVGWLLWRLHPRARLGFYVFASCEVIRFWRGGLAPWGVPVVYLALIACLYTPGARTALPLIRPGERLASYGRLRPGRRAPAGDRDQGADAS
jgi:hypothetical protein